MRFQNGLYRSLASIAINVFFRLRLSLKMQKRVTQAWATGRHRYVRWMDEVVVPRKAFGFMFFARVRVS